jgi:abhydrolase domain-containing protein 1/3
MNIEEELTLKTFRFRSVEEYYSDASCINYLYDVKVPSLFISSRDDILSPVHVIDHDKGKWCCLFVVRKNKNLILLITDQGGHLCFFSGFWEPNRVILYIYL